MDVVDHPERDQAWDTTARSETEAQRLDRNWLSLLQELRVVQTGVQLLTGFLLTLPFQPRFDVLDATMRVIFLATVGCSVGATVLLEAPVAMHRMLFRRHRIESVVAAAHRFAYAGFGSYRSNRDHFRRGGRPGSGRHCRSLRGDVSGRFLGAVAAAGAT